MRGFIPFTGYMADDGQDPRVELAQDNLCRPDSDHRSPSAAPPSPKDGATSPEVSA